VEVDSRDRILVLDPVVRMIRIFEPRVEEEPVNDPEVALNMNE
jgi:hypothetical protein